MALWHLGRALGSCPTAVRMLMAVCLVTIGATAGWALASPTHPLDPLTAGELATVREVLIASGRFSRGTKFAWIELEEPPKALVEQFHAGDDFPRKADLTAIDFAAAKSFAVRVDIKARRIIALDELKGLQPGLTDHDIDVAREIVGADQRIAAALLKRGIAPHDGLRMIRVLYMGVGTDPTLQSERGRLLRVMFVSDTQAINDFGPVLDGLMAVVDVYARRVVRLYDDPGAPILKVPHDIFDPTVRGPPSRAFAPPVTVSGRSFRIEGHVVDWGSWRFRYGFNWREGLVLYQLSFDDHGRRRPIVYRASVSEIISRYADTTATRAPMEFFDESNFGLGYLAAALAPGRELPGNAVMLAALLAGPDQSSFSPVYRDSIYVYERDAGNLLYYQQGERRIAARATELVIGFMVPLGNYTYGLNWVFKQDGSFAFEAELAGEILTELTRAKRCEACTAIVQAPGASNSKAPHDGAAEPFATLVHPNVLGLDHQHWFSLRLDFDVDGSANAVMENDVRPTLPTAGGAPEGGSLTLTHTILARAVDAKRDADASRTWTIYNPSSLGPTGRPVGYAVVPGESVATLYPSASEPGIAAFTFHQFWVTPYRDGELFADGRYPNQPPPDYADTLFHYANEQSVFDRDVVVWYSLGETHVPRPEDYPLMPTMKLSVLFRPEGFFSRDPSLGLAHESDR
jgi:primary-amine oxidase